MTRTNFFATLVAPLLFKLGLKKTQPIADIHIPDGRMYEKPLWVEFAAVGPTTVTFPNPSQFDYCELTFDGGKTYHRFRNGDKFILDSDTGEMTRIKE